MFAHVEAKGGHWASSSTLFSSFLSQSLFLSWKLVLSADWPESSGIACLHIPVLLEATGG